jgi:Na+/H+-translocating membrane pyrophosphatase
VFGVFRDDSFEKRPGLRWAFQAKKALAKVSASVNVLRIAFERGAVTGLGLVELALLEINVAQLEVVMRFVEVMNLRLEFLYAAALLGAGQFKAACGRN